MMTVDVLFEFLKTMRLGTFESIFKWIYFGENSMFVEMKETKEKELAESFQYDFNLGL